MEEKSRYIENLVAASEVVLEANRQNLITQEEARQHIQMYLEEISSLYIGSAMHNEA